MAKFTIALGLLLIGLGLVAYFGLSGDTKSVTALIPSFFGLPMLILGIVALKPGARKHAIHGALALAVLGILGTASAARDLPALLTEPDQLARPAASAVRLVMAVLCVVFVVAGVTSFVKARRGSGAATS